METYITVNAKFDDKNKHGVRDLVRCFTPLLASEQDYEVDLEDLRKRFKSINRYVGYKIEWLVKAYGPYLLCDRINEVSPTQIRLSFTCGSDGIEFGRDFAYVLYTFGAINAYCSFRHDEDPNGNEKAIYAFDKDSIEAS